MQQPDKMALFVPVVSQLISSTLGLLLSETVTEVQWRDMITAALFVQSLGTKIVSQSKACIALTALTNHHLTTQVRASYMILHVIVRHTATSVKCVGLHVKPSV